MHKYPFISSVYQLIPPASQFSIYFLFMFSIGKMNPFLPFFLASFLFFISHSQTTSNTSSQHRCLPDQSSALLQLRQEFVEDMTDSEDNGVSSFSKMKSWKADTDCCSWDGVACNAENGHVIDLDLSNSGLYGPLKSNSSLFSLHQLQKLNLAFNNFNSSTIPSEFGQLVRLTSLSLFDCSLRGQFSTNIFLMPKLKTIDLSLNDLLTGFLPEFHSGSSLEKLHLSSTSFSGKLPNSIANLEALIELDLSHTAFSGEIPNAIGNLKSLNILDLAACNLSGEVPLSITNLTHLSVLSLSGNNFHGQLPSTVGNLANLTDLSLENNLFHGEIPSSLGNLTQLKILYLYNNSFDGRLPVSLANLSQLQRISLSSNQLIGPIPFEMGRLPQLTSISLSFNSLSGTIPSSLFTMTSLAELDLSQNRLTGTLKFQNFSSSQLTSISLNSNSLTGTIPSSLFTMTSLAILDLTQNRLTGPLKFQNISSSKLTFISLTANSLTGTIPSSLFTITSLTSLYLFQNQLTGPLKFQNISSSQLEILFMSENNLYGPIPRSISNFTHLQHLDLSSINLKDMLELDIFFEIKRIETLLLSGNKLLISKGKINSTLPKFKTLGLSSCNLREFPIFLKVQNELTYLDLSDNKIEGKVPK